MRKALENRSSPVPVLAMVLLAALAGCTTKGTSTPTTPDVAQPRVKASELRAYCPTVTLRDGTAYFSTYSGDRTPDNVVYQAALTAACTYANTQMAAKYDVVNPGALKRLVAAGTQLRPFPQDVLEASLKASNELYSEISAKNADFKKAIDAMAAFRSDEYLWWQIAELTFDVFQVRTRAR